MQEEKDYLEADCSEWQSIRPSLKLNLILSNSHLTFSEKIIQEYLDDQTFLIFVTHYLSLVTKPDTIFFELL